MHNYKTLDIYKDSFALTKEIYRITKMWPPEEKYVLVPQIRRSAHSVNSNICEGASRISNADFSRFLHNAYASLQETQNHLCLAHELRYISAEDFQILNSKIESISKRTYSLIKYLKPN